MCKVIEKIKHSCFFLTRHSLHDEGIKMQSRCGMHVRVVFKCVATRSLNALHTEQLNKTLIPKDESSEQFSSLI